MEIVTSCPSCGARFKFTEKYFGRNVKCPKCAGAIAVPQPDGGDQGQRCPSCGVTLGADATLCPQCGYDLALANLVDSAPTTPKSGPRAAVGRRAAGRGRARGNKIAWLVTGGAVGLVLLAAGAICVYLTVSGDMPPKTPESSPSVLVLDWPPEERFTGAVKIDDRKLALPESGDVQYSVPSGKHRVVLSREGYEPLEIDLSLGGGQRHHYKPQWVLAKAATDEPEQGPGPVAPAGTPAAPGADAAKALANFDDWLQDFEAAKKKAAAESKDVLVLFNGSDWCGWSIRLAYEVLLQKDFRSRAEGRYVLVSVDFPRKAQNKAKVQDPIRNQQLSQKFHVRGYPEVVVTDAEGNPFGFFGYVEGGSDAFFQTLSGCQTLRIERDEAFRAIETAEGNAKLKAIEKGLAFLKQARLWPFYGPVLDKWSATALKADPKNESAVPESVFEMTWLLGFVGEDFEKLKPKQAAEIVGRLDGWKKEHPFKDPDRAARLHLRAAVLLGVTRQSAEAAKYVEAAVAYHPKDRELREELAGIAAAIRGVGAGTGFVVASGGLVLTNHHVIEGAKKLGVQLPGRKEPVAAKVIADDSRRDLALLQLDVPADVKLQPMPVARQTVGRGAKVGAFGFPITGAVGSGLKLTTGIVSAEPDESTRGMLLLDCRINPGNSGGPLCDVRGNVVGVVTAKSVGGYGVESFGMALPVEVIHEFLSEKLPKGAKLAPAVRAKKTLEWDEIDGMVNASVLLIMQGQ